MLDIASALDAAPAPTGRKCKIRAWLDAIDPATPRLAELVTMVETPAPRGTQHPNASEKVALILGSLGLDISSKAIDIHRRGSCRCYR